MEPYQYSMMYGLLGGLGNVNHANRAADAWRSLSRARAPRAAVSEHTNLGKPRVGWASSLHAGCLADAHGLRCSELPEPPDVPTRQRPLWLVRERRQGGLLRRLSHGKGGCALGRTVQPHPTSWGVIAGRDGHSTEEGVWISSCVDTRGRMVGV